jgi:RHS repeat-associated protein
MTNANKLARRLASWTTLAALLLTGAAQAQTVIYYHTDALGSPVATTDAAGTVIERSEYEPYGQVLNHSIADGPGYTGHVSDAQTGLSYMQQRYYDPLIGRFLSLDPVTADAATGGNFNRYWYANNNPYRFVDPDGRQSFRLGPSVQDTQRAKLAPLLTAGQNAGAKEMLNRSSVNAKGTMSAGTGVQVKKNLAGNSSDSVGWVPVGQGGYAGVSADIKVVSVDLLPNSSSSLPASLEVSGDVGAIVSMGGAIELDAGGQLDITLSPGLGIGEHTSFSPKLNLGVNEKEQPKPMRIEKEKEKER